jgi:hypothetical protein
MQSFLNSLKTVVRAWRLAVVKNFRQIKERVLPPKAGQSTTEKQDQT